MVQVDPSGKATFVFRHGVTGPVYLVGDFCRWQRDHLPMRRASENEWVLMLRLPPGMYEFRYLANGQWYTDYAAFGVNANSFHEYNSVVRVPKSRPVLKQPARMRRLGRRRMARSA